jgi:hypothetical protein
MFPRMTMSIATTEEIWRQRVRAWRASGETAAQFARGRGFAAATLRAWSSRLRRNEAPAFVRLLPKPSPASQAPRELVVEVGDARVRVAPGFDPDLLADVLRALRAGAR